MTETCEKKKKKIEKIKTWIIFFFTILQIKPRDISVRRL